MKELIDEIMIKFSDFTSGVRVMMLIDRGAQNNNKGSRRWINKLVSTESYGFRENLEKLIDLQYYLKNPDIRIYSCVNDRKLDSAIKHFQHKQLDISDEAQKISFYTHINDNFCSALMQPENRYGRKFLLDIDSENCNEEELVLLDNEINYFKYKTKSGWHFVTAPFHPTLVDKSVNIDLKKDGLLLLNWIKEE